LATPIYTWGSHRLSPGSLLTVQDLAAFQPEVVEPLEMPLGNYTLYSPPPPAGGAILSFILNVLKGKTFSGFPSAL
jgi:gamma-glutamyltranspeptidase/glutathione hydrolase/leukotriene-C4 hydrolase